MSRRRLFIVGPTASGKGRLAVEVARLAGGEVVSVDSMKVYRGMDIGTAKPSAEERRGVPFHLLDIRDPHESMSVAEFIREAEVVEADILSRGRLPVFEGGTALYVRGLTEGVFDGPPADWDLRRSLEKLAAEGGNEALHARLRSVDPVTANRLHPNDLRRVIRAIEVHEKTGRPISAQQREWAGFLEADAPADDRPENASGPKPRVGGPGGRASFPPRSMEVAGPRAERVREGRVLYGLDRDRDALNARIDERVDRMFAAGFVAEAERLLARPGGIGREAEQALGYRELFRWLRPRPRDDRPEALGEVVEKVKRDTRRFARRQLTFLRHFPDIRHIRIFADTNVADLAARIVEELG